jgi:3-oxoadipate enol-lactonase
MDLRHVDHEGVGPALVLLHAFPLDSGMYDRLVPLIADGARVVTIDLPGLGGSPVAEEPPSITAIADGVVEVLDGLGIERASVLGTSTGGHVALALATIAPHRLDSLVLASTTPHRIAPDVPDERRVVAAEIERLGSTKPVHDSADDGIGATAHREQPDLVDMLRRTIDDADPVGVAWVARAIADREDTTAALAEFPGHVELLFGSEDEATPPERGEEMLALRDPDRTRLTVLERTGHLSSLESPEAVADVVRRVLGGGS